MDFRRVVPMLVLALGLAGRPIRGQTTGTERKPGGFEGKPSEANTYGTSIDSILTVGSWAFVSEDSSQRILDTAIDGRYTFGAPACLDASVNLPSGAYIDFFELVGCDTSTTTDEEVNAGLVVCDVFSANCHLAGNVVRTSGAPGCVVLASNVIGETVDNSANLYHLRVCTQSGNSTTYFRAVRIWYRLQVSPAPATATFGDVPTSSIYFRAIEALAKSGITSGCGNGNFCPNQPVTRGELAKFLANALGLQWK